jgi:hypothetical protein
VKNWKIHLAWAVLTPLLAALWGRWCVAPWEPEVLGRDRTIEVGVRAEPGRRPPSVASTAREPVPEDATGTPAPLRTEASAPTEEQAFVDSIRRLFESERSEDWFEASRRLCRIPKGPVRVDLLRGELGCKGSRFRYEALNYLEGDLGPEVVSFLQDALRSDPEASNRSYAAERLGIHGGAATANLLLEACRDPDPQVHLTAAASLNGLGQPGPAEDLLPSLAAGLNDSDDAARREATENICRLKLVSAIPVLLRCFRDSNGDVRFTASRGLAELEAPGLLPALEELRKDPDPVVGQLAQSTILLYRKQREEK